MVAQTEIENMTEGKELVMEEKAGTTQSSQYCFKVCNRTNKVYRDEKTDD